jgi:hypothetical protein
MMDRDGFIPFRLLERRNFKGERGTHMWKAYEVINIVDKKHADDKKHAYLIVTGVRNKKVVVEDPTYDTNVSSKIRTYVQ